MSTDLDVAIDAARAGAEVVRSAFGSATEVRLKGDVDPVTAVDEAAERAIVAHLTEYRPDDLVLGEEAGGAAWDTGRVWVVDPLDGTINFLHSIPHVAVSVALWSDGRPAAGVVVDVMRSEVFSAAAGEGARLDGRPARVSSHGGMTGSVVATGFPYDRRSHAGSYSTALGAVLAEAQGVRRFGSAALDLAWVACGRYDAYWEYGLAPWDSAAGGLLVSEAGGRVTDHRSEPHRLDAPAIVASNGHIHDELARLVADHIPEHLR